MLYVTNSCIFIIIARISLCLTFCDDCASIPYRHRYFICISSFSPKQIITTIIMFLGLQQRKRNSYNSRISDTSMQRTRDASWNPYRGFLRSRTLCTRHAKQTETVPYDYHWFWIYDDTRLASGNNIESRASRNSKIPMLRAQLPTGRPRFLSELK